MGTRNLTCAYLSGEYKVAQYGQWDGYPSGVGLDILRTLRSVDLNLLKESVSKCRWITESEMAEIDDQIESARKLIPNWEWSKRWPELSRDTGGDIFKLILFDQKYALKNSIDFAGDSLFCEWAYVVDFDAGKFEVYSGFNQTPLNPDERFSAYKPDTTSTGNTYYPVKLCASFNLDELPTEDAFLAAFKSEDDE